MDEKILIFQPNAVVTTTLTNNAALSVRTLVLKNKDEVGLPYEQYAEALEQWCINFRDVILKSPRIKPEDLENKEERQIGIHFTQNEKASVTVLIVQEVQNRLITDPMLCESVHNWVLKLNQQLGRKANG